MFCPNCGEKIDDDARFCPYCGSNLNDYAVDSGGSSGSYGRRDGDNRSGRYSQRNRYDSGDVHDDQGGASVPDDEFTDGNGSEYGTGEFPTDRRGRDVKRGKNHSLLPAVIAIVAAVCALAVTAFLVLRRGPALSAAESNAVSAVSGTLNAENDAGSTAAAQNASPGDLSLQSAAEGNGTASSETKTETDSETGADAGADAGGTDFASLSARAASKTSGNLNFISSDVSDYPSVRLYYSYTDSSDAPITLTSPTAGITEQISGGAAIERTVRSIERLEGNQGLSIDIVADKSGSMEYDLPSMQNIMTSFVENLDYASGDRAEIISFDSYTMYMCTYTSDVSLLRNGISNMTADGDTALYDALYEGITNAGSQAGARCVIGFTDGADNRSIYTPEEVISHANALEVPVYLVGTAGADQSTLEQIAYGTGGYYWNISTITDLSQILDEIYANEKDQYCITYESDSSIDAYAERIISCVLFDDTYGGESDNVSVTPTKAIVKTAHSSRYELVKGDISWTDANSAAIAKGGHLVTITSASEEQQIEQMAAAAGLKYIWIGGYTSIRSGQAFGHWITGEAFDYTNWYPGEPSRTDSGDGAEEFYLMLWNVEGEWSWNDERNDPANSQYEYFKGNIGYVIEYEE